MISYNEVTTLFVGGNEPFSFGSIGEALNYVAELRRIGVGQPISIKLTAPEYTLKSTLVIGNNLNDVTIEPYGNTRVTIRGGVEITGFEPGKFNGVDCLCAPIPNECKNADGGCNFTDFYVNGKRAELTHYPAEGWLYAEAVENNAGALFSPSKWFIANPGDLDGIKNIERAQMTYCHYWIDEHTPIESYDPETRRVTMKYKSRFFIGGPKNSASALEYRLENIAEAFANPGEWYADDGKIYYIPRDKKETAETLKAYAPIVSKLIDVRGTPEKPVRGIRFRNIDFSVTRGEYGSCGGDPNSEDGVVKDELFASDAQAVSDADGSITFKYANCCAVEKCSLKNYGVHGFVVDLGCHGIRIDSCDMYDGGAGGVKIVGGAWGCPDYNRTYGNTVDNCTILYCGRRYFAACGVLMIHTYENVISHNEIGYLYYTGVSGGWVWGYKENMTHDNIITKNHIHHLGDGMLSDMGGVYLLGIQPGTIVSNNIIHDISSKNYGGWAMYTDEGSSNITVENNICYNTSDNSYHQHYGSMNTVRNNIFAFAGHPLLRVSRTEPHLSIVYERNIVYSNNVPMYDFSRAQLSQKTVSLSNNLYFDCSRKKKPIMRDFGEEKLTLADVQAMGLEQGSIVADPGFADAKHFDFTLSPDSPAFALGFVPIDTSDVGAKR